MAVTDFFVGEIAVELLKELAKICKKSSSCKAAAELLMQDINKFLPNFREIQYSGVELPQIRQQQIEGVIENLKEGLELCVKIVSSTRWNVYKNLQFKRKLERIEKNVSRFIAGPMQVHIVADLHHVRLGVDRLNEMAERLKIGGVSNSGNNGWLEDAMKTSIEEEQMNGPALVDLVGTGVVLAKKKVKEMILGKDSVRVIGICGIGGSGKTTLASELSRDPQIRKHFHDRVYFVTVSQSPNLELLKQTLGAKLTHFGSGWQLEDDRGYGGGQSLVILDDVWSLHALEQLIINVPGCKTLVVSRFKFPTVFNQTYDVELLRDDEAMSLFCYSAFGQKSIPSSVDRKLVEQVVVECKGLPLALKVIGASLRDQHQMFWTSAKNRLSRGETICESHEMKLLKSMEVSIGYLSEKVRECFLDLASFPEDKKIPLDVLVNMWAEIHDLDAEEAFAILVELSNKNLITLVKDARAGDTYSSYFEISVTEHDVLRDMALHCCNRVNLNERRRLLMPRREDRLPKEWERNMDKPFQAQIVSIHTGEMKEWDWFPMDFPKAEVLILNFSSSEYYLPPFINKMPKLRALVLINNGNSNAVLHNISVFSTFSNLRSLWLEKVIMPSAHNVTTPLSNLHKISLVLCDFGNNLCGSILDIPLMLPRLSELSMDHCISLTELPSNICNITSLKNLSITNCHDFFNLPTDLGKLKSLLILRLCSCPALEKLPESIGALDSLMYLDISQCVNLRSLPERMGGMNKLEKIDMRECSQIRNLPASVLAMRQLRRVICDEEASWLWREVERVAPDLQVEVAEECFNLDWLSE
ncbi:DNA-binding transcription factor adr1 [Ranunculus cassubicifolius]